MITRPARTLAPTMLTVGLTVWLTGGLAIVLAGCGATDPYVYKAREFDRDDPSFNKPITDRSEVLICYNGLVTGDDELAAIAAAECGRFGKTATRRSGAFNVCPLFVPAVARFDCEATAASLPAAAAQEPPAAAEALPEATKTP